MDSITQDMKWKQCICEYALKNGVTESAKRYKVNRQFVYRQLKKYDGTIRSLALKSRKPHSHPRQHKESEIKLIKDMRRRNPYDGLVVFWWRLKRKGYERSITALFRVMRKLGMFKDKKSKKKKYIPKPYEQMQYPGQRVQIDVKYVPKECCKGKLEGEKLYQYTAIDEYSRKRFLYIYNEKSTYTSTDFMQKVMCHFPFKIECVQTDNGCEFTNKLMAKRPTKTMFEAFLEDNGVLHKTIRVATPRHNGKVERSHRNDNERFYIYARFLSLEDANAQIKRYMRVSNNFPMRPLNWMSADEKLNEYIQKVG